MLGVSWEECLGWQQPAAMQEVGANRENSGEATMAVKFAAALKVN